MKATQVLRNLGQSIWLDNIARDLLDSGTLKYYIAELSRTGLTSHPTIFNHEQASTFGWERYTGRERRIIGMRTFAASAPLKELQRKFGFEPNLVVKAAKQLLGKG